MAVKSNISWTDATWNPHFGCKKVSEGCKFCYMHRILEGQKKDGNLIFQSPSEIEKPKQWKNPKLIFTCSMSDFFIEETDEWRDKYWEVIKETKHHTYLILTKRPERIKDCLPKDWSIENYPNVWLGVTVESNKVINRIHYLEDIECSVKWVSFEPLLSEIYLKDRELSIINWAVIGGESGNDTGKYLYRKSELSWFLSLMYQLSIKGTPLFFKQFGTWYHKNEFFLKDSKGEKYCPNFPGGFRIRQFPERVFCNENNLKKINYEK